MAPGNRKNPKHAAWSDSQYTLLQFTQDFPDDETCLQWLWRARFAPDGEHAFCERCEVERVFRRYTAKQQRQDWTCTACGLHVHPTAGTIFHKSSTGLHLWFYAMYLMTSTRCGISAKQLERELGVTYKTAWRMFTLIRNELMAQDDETLSGQVEMDETYMGGKPRLADKVEFGKSPAGRQSAAVKWAHDKKTTVFGMTQRKEVVHLPGQPVHVVKPGKISAYVAPKKPQAEIMAHIDNRVDVSAVVYTDDSRLYDRLGKKGLDHKVIDHSAKIYVNGDVHTQTIDGFWMLLKTGIVGSHHAVSPKWLQGYLNEYVWRYNHREDKRAMFATLLLRAAWS